MAYGIVKVDQITFTNGGIDQTISVSGIVQSISGNITATGTIQGTTIIGTSTVSGATVTGDAGVFTTVTGGSAGFTTVTGTTVTGTTANFTTLSGTTVTGSVGNFGSGSAAAPAVSVGTTDNGIYSPGTDQVALSTSGVGRLFVDASGNVGVGTELPQNQLHLNSNSFAIARFSAGGDQSSLLRFYDQTGTLKHELAFGNGGVADYTNAFKMTVNGTERLRITSAGLVGIGTSSPGNLVTVQSSASNTAPELKIQNPINSASSQGAATGLSGGRLLFGATGTYANAGRIEYRYSSVDASFGRNGSFVVSTIRTDTNALTDAVTIDSAQRVGIGTTSPAGPCHIYRGLTHGEVLRLSGSPDGDVRSLTISTEAAAGINGALYRFNIASGSGTYAFSAANTELARLDYSGRLLIGTSTGATVGDAQVARVQIVGNSIQAAGSGLLSICREEAATSITSGDVIGRIVFGDSSGNPFSFITAEADANAGSGDYPGRLVFSVTADGSASPSEAMRINNAGELLVGYTSDNGAYKLQVNSQIFATSAIIATSDGRYKENVAALDGCVDLVKALRPVSFDWKAQEPVTRVDEDGETVVVREAHNFPDGKQVGFIAQEVEEVLADKPWLGSVIKQNVRPAVTDADGNELAPEEEFLGIAEGNLVAVLTSALKDAIGRIESLEAEVAALKA